MTSARSYKSQEEAISSDESEIEPESDVRKPSASQDTRPRKTAPKRKSPTQRINGVNVSSKRNKLNHVAEAKSPPKARLTNSTNGTQSGSDGSESSSSGEEETTFEMSNRQTNGHQSDSGDSETPEDSDDADASKNTRSSEDPEDPEVIGASNDSLILSHIPYEPPPGFVPLETEAVPNKEIEKALSPSSITGKQIWHITAPSSVALSALQEFVLDKALKGRPLLTQDGLHYGIRQVAGNKAQFGKILCPQKGEEAYAEVAYDFTHSFHVHQILNDESGAMHSGSNSGHQNNRNVVRPTKQQPDNLRTRYWPPGFEQEKLQNYSIRRHNTRVPQAPTQAVGNTNPQPLAQTTARADNISSETSSEEEEGVSESESSTAGEQLPSKDVEMLEQPKGKLTRPRLPAKPSVSSSESSEDDSDSDA